MTHRLVKLFGWKGLLWYGDTISYDRWLWLREQIKSGTQLTLDAGCGHGAFSLYAALQGNTVTGITFSSDEVKTAESTARLLNITTASFIDGDLRFLPDMNLPAHHYDQIICCETIEHILNDRKLTEDLTRLLKPGGWLYLTTPYLHHPALFGEKLSEEEDGGHVRWGYTHDELTALLESCGYTIETKGFIGGRISQHLTNLYRRINVAGLPGASYLVQLLRRAAWFDPAWTRITKQPFHCVGVSARLHPDRNHD